MSFDYPDIVEVVAFHDVLIEEFGGTMGMRDEGALASVIMRPVCDFTVRAKTPSLLRILLEEHDILRVGPAPEKPDGETYALFLDGTETVAQQRSYSVQHTAIRYPP